MHLRKIYQQNVIVNDSLLDSDGVVCRRIQENGIGIKSFPGRTMQDDGIVISTNERSRCSGAKTLTWQSQRYKCYAEARDSFDHAFSF